MSAVSIGLAPFYPIVPDLPWLERLLPLGVKTVQLRLKDVSRDEVRQQVHASKTAAERTGCTLIVNDYWREAIDSGCRWVHLGQEDLADADVAAIKKAGLKLGISTHSEAELEIALAAHPDYVALGPIWETKLKAMKWAPQGLDRLRAWRRRIGGLPLVGIAGITLERAPSVLEAGADCCAVITDFITHPDPEARIRAWQAWSDASLSA
jgi:thiamine-phosphate pyrophosphorylase